MPVAARVSMTDVAQRAGVSQKTVSRVVNDEPHVTEQVRVRVRAAIADLGFRPNGAARALVTRRSHRIGLLVADSTRYGPLSLIRHFERAVRERGYQFCVATVGGSSRADIQAAIDDLISHGAEGLAASGPVPDGLAELSRRTGIPALILGSARHTDGVVLPNVGIDERAGARAATRHLRDLGHTRVHHIAGPADWCSAALRAEGWRSAHPGRPPALVAGDWSPASGYAAMRALLDRVGRPPTAVFVANDEMALGAVHALREAGLRVPADVSIVGFDDAPFSAYLSPTLTTVVQDFDAVTRAAATALIDLVEGTPTTFPPAAHPPRLLIRESTAPPPA